MDGFALILAEVLMMMIFGGFFGKRVTKKRKVEKILHKKAGL